MICRKLSDEIQSEQLKHFYCTIRRVRINPRRRILNFNDLFRIEIFGIVWVGNNWLSWSKMKAWNDKHSAADCSDNSFIGKSLELDCVILYQHQQILSFLPQRQGEQFSNDKLKFVILPGGNNELRSIHLKTINPFMNNNSARPPYLCVISKVIS